jgi:nucleotidyltransferase substrate binding protein (TIGR01987 family)
MSVSLEEFKKAMDALAIALKLAHEREHIEIEFKIARDACIQRFEFCIELAWKTSAKLMGSSSTTAKMVIREMAQNGFISDTGIWFEFVDARNKTSHSYDEDVARQVYTVAQKFIQEGQKLLSILETK